MFVLFSFFFLEASPGFPRQGDFFFFFFKSVIMLTAAFLLEQRSFAFLIKALTREEVGGRLLEGNPEVSTTASLVAGAGAVRCIVGCLAVALLLPPGCQ